MRLSADCAVSGVSRRVIRCCYLLVLADTPINMIEVGVGAASTPRGLHLLHATGQDNLHLELVCKSNELKKEESPLYSLTFSQIVHEAEKKDSKISTSGEPQTRAATS